MVLPSIPRYYVEKLEKLMENFIWNGQRPKIVLRKLQALVKNGGLGLVNLVQKDKALKITWLNELMHNENLVEFTSRKLCPILRMKVWDLTLKIQHINTCFPKDSFWRDVLCAWSEYKGTGVDKGNVLSQIIWYNSHITSGGVPIRVNEQAYHKGLMYVSQLFDEVGKKRKATDISEMYNVNLILCNQIVSSVPEDWGEYIVQARQDLNVQGNANLDPLKKVSSKVCYQKLCNDEQVFHSAYVKWQCQLQTDKSYKDFVMSLKNVRKTTNNSKLRTFQFRLLNNAIILDTQLCQWGIKDTNKCTFCNEQKETVEHFFSECKYANEIMGAIDGIIREKYFDTEEGVYNVTNIIFNTGYQGTGHLGNFLILVGKYYLYV